MVAGPQNATTLLDMLAVCVSRMATADSTNWTTAAGEQYIASQVTIAAGLDMWECWTATKDSYLGRVPKALILDAVREGVGTRAVFHSVTDPAEVALFLRLGPGVRLGAGECSAVAVALSRGYGVAIDDNRAINVALRESALVGTKLTVLRTPDIMVALIRASALTVDEADRVKAEWEQHHRFRLKARSFRDLL